MGIIDLTKKITAPDVIDLTEEPKDYISGLPPEIIHHICSYLFASHEPSKRPSEYDAGLEDDRTAGKERLRPKKGQKDYHHDLDHLAATSTYLRAQVNEWATHFLLQHQDITNYKQPKVFQYGVRRNILRSGRPAGLLNWSARHCCFCGKKSVRSAILMNGLRCCRPCDDKHWPDKMTKTAARIHGHLRQDQLMPREAAVSPTCRDLYAAKCGSSGIRYGIYLVYGQETTMFLRKDVEALARRVHGPNITFPFKGSHHHFRRAQVATTSTNVTISASGGGSGGGGGGGLGHRPSSNTIERALQITAASMALAMRAVGHPPPSPAGWRLLMSNLRLRIAAGADLGPTISSAGLQGGVNGVITATLNAELSSDSDSARSAVPRDVASNALRSGLAAHRTLLMPLAVPPPPLQRSGTQLLGQATVTRISTAPPAAAMDLLPPSAQALGRSAIDVGDDEIRSSPEELAALDASELFGLAVAPREFAVYD